MSYLGKRVEVLIFARDEYGKTTTQKTNIVGICEREPTEYKWREKAYYTVINRQPVIFESMREIKVVE